MLSITAISLLSMFALASGRFYSIENPDGSFNFGTTSDSQGEAANSVIALLTKAAGYTIDDNFEGIPSVAQPPQRVLPENNSDKSRGLLTPHMEILQLIEAFLKFKGELAVRIQDIFSDNYDLIRSVYQTVISKIGTLHTFTLTGIKILRKILEFAVSLMVQWQVNLPGLSLDFNVGGSGTPQKNSQFYFQ